jgi:hypothetical protein
MADVQRTPTLSDRFWAKVNKTDGCWIWTAAKQPLGYGSLGPTYQERRAHRFSWLLANGPIPEGAWVLHRCDNPSCVRPDHLFLGDSRANVLDMHAKGRDRNGNESLTHCLRGHEFNEQNTRVTKGGGRSCRVCMREHFKKYNATKRAERRRQLAREHLEMGLCRTCPRPIVPGLNYCRVCHERRNELRRRHVAKKAAGDEED